jgi:spermidine/putrescine transport system ATP-binding protein
VNAAVRLTGVGRSYGPVVAVRDVGFEVERGEVLALLGPSGCGKTTTLRLIAGFETPDSGTVEVGGRAVAGPGQFVPPERRRIGMVFQDYALFPHLTVARNVAYGLPNGKKKARVAEVLALAHLEGLGGRMPHELSGGQQQRVALARALVLEPKVLLLDEPLGALDLKLRKEMQLELKSLQHEVGITFVYVTHDQEEALTMSDRIAVMNEGRVQQLAGPTTLYETPANRFVAGFIGQTNVFSGTVEAAEGERTTLRTREGMRVEALAREGVPPKEGEEAHAAVRPEKVRFGGSGDNVCAAEVRQVVYLGASTQYIVELEGGGRLVLYQQNAHDAAGPSEGDGVSVAWDAQNCLILEG